MSDQWWVIKYGPVARTAVPTSDLRIMLVEDLDLKPKTPVRYSYPLSGSLYTESVRVGVTLSQITEIDNDGWMYASVLLDRSVLDTFMDRLGGVQALYPAIDIGPDVETELVNVSGAHHVFLMKNIQVQAITLTSFPAWPDMPPIYEH